MATPGYGTTLIVNGTAVGTVTEWHGVPVEHPEEAAFWAAIGERPDDQLPRLVFADWLDDRAERMHCPHCGGGRPGEWMLAVNDAGDCEMCSGYLFVPDGREELATALRATAGRVPRYKNGRWQWRRDGAGDLHTPFRLPVLVWIEACRISLTNAHRTRWARFVSAESAVRFMCRAWMAVNRTQTKAGDCARQ